MALIVGSGDGLDVLSGGSENDFTVTGTLNGTSGVVDAVTVRSLLVTTPAVDTQDSTGSSNTSGVYSVDVMKNTDTYLEFAKIGYATLNSAFDSYSQDTAGVDFEMLLIGEAETDIDTAFAGMVFALPDKAWLAVNVETIAGAEVDGATVGTSLTAGGGGALNCDGTLTGANITTALPACVPPRVGPMYLAYFDAAAEVTISVGGSAVVAPVRVGELTSVTFVQ